MQETPETWVRYLGREDHLEEEMTTHSSILAGKIPWTEEPGGWQSIGWQRVRHDWARTGLVAPWHVGSSWIRDGTCVSCTGRQILYHWGIREAPQIKLISKPSVFPESIVPFESCLVLPQILIQALEKCSTLKNLPLSGSEWFIQKFQFNIRIWKTWCFPLVWN